MPATEFANVVRTKQSLRITHDCTDKGKRVWFIEFEDPTGCDDWCVAIAPNKCEVLELFNEAFVREGYGWTHKPETQYRMVLVRD